MVRSVGDRLPLELQSMLDGTDLAARVGFTVSLITMEQGGWPRVALLSVGEILAPDDRRLHLALWPGTTTTRELTRTGQATLSCIVAGVAYSVHARLTRGDDLRAADMDHAYFAGSVEESFRDTVGYARLTGGITFELPDRAAVVARWQATIDAMRRRAIEPGRHPAA